MDNKPIQPKPLVEKPRVEKVVKGNVKVNKHDVRKFTDVFISEDIKSVKDHILVDVLVPTIKKALVDMVTDGVRMMFFGKSGVSGKSSPASKVSYTNYYNGNNYQSQPTNNGVRASYSYDSVIIDSRMEAEEVLARMQESVKIYGMVSVAEFYDLVGLTGNFQDNKYGWTNLRNADVVPTISGWMIKLPKAIPLN